MHRNLMVHKCTLRHRRSEIPSRASKGRNAKSKHRRKPAPRGWPKAMRLLAKAMPRASIQGLAYGHGPSGEVSMKKYTEKFCHDSVIFAP